MSFTGAIGILAKTGRYGGTFAHRDIAFEFDSLFARERIPNLLFVFLMSNILLQMRKCRWKRSSSFDIVKATWIL